MRKTIIGIAIIALLLQAFLAFALAITPMAAQFTSVLDAFRPGGTPAWSRLVFGAGVDLLLVPAMLSAALVTVLSQKRATMWIVLIAAGGVCGLLLILIAMYPLPLIQLGAVT